MFYQMVSNGLYNFGSNFCSFFHDTSYSNRFLSFILQLQQKNGKYRKMRETPSLLRNYYLPANIYRFKGAAKL